MFGFSKLDVLMGKRAPDEVRIPYGDLTAPQVRFRQEQSIRGQSTPRPGMW